MSNHPELSRAFRTVILCAALTSGGAHAETVDVSNNTIAAHTLGSLTSGQNNSAYGVGALFEVSSGNDNSAFGLNALANITTATGNSAFGVNALAAATTGNHNSAFGISALQRLTTGSGNVALGQNAMVATTRGNNNVAVGMRALEDNIRGGGNTALGAGAMTGLVSGNGNVAVGVGAMQGITSGSSNIGIGLQSLFRSSTASNNIAIGENTLFNSFGGGNIAIGRRAGFNLRFGAGNLLLDNEGIATDQRTIRIGTQGRHRAAFMAGVRGVNVTGGLPVVVRSNGQLGIQASSRRFKQDIAPMADASARLLELAPVTFRYKAAEADGSRPLQYGLIAEEVAEVFPELVAHDAQGEVESVAYQTLSVLLLNEFQKQHSDFEIARATLAAVARDTAKRDAELVALRAEVAELRAAAAELLALQRATSERFAQSR
ncbi:MAG: tail fiber domain-containing protein [Gammaproteobacteria bacterium]